eukprot:m.8568 g.8568  ORF g.8568 m.8568 type:complete len:59 (+) comp9220_c0_seq4:411-587(+)
MISAAQPVAWLRKQTLVGQLVAEPLFPSTEAEGPMLEEEGGRQRCSVVDDMLEGEKRP